MVRIGEKTGTTMPAVASAHTTAAISVNPPGTNRNAADHDRCHGAEYAEQRFAYRGDAPLGLHHTRRLVAGYAKGPLP